MRRSLIERVLLAAIILDGALQVDKYLFYQEADAAYGAVAGLVISVTTFCLAILYLGWMFKIALRPGCPEERIRLSFPAICYLGAVALSGVFAADRKLAFYDFFVLLQAFLLYVYISNRIRDRRSVIHLVTLLSATLLLEALIVIGVWLVGHDVSIRGIEAGIEDSRVRGTVGSPNTTGSFLALLLVPAASIWFTPLGGWRRVLAAFTVCACLLALVLTQSRGAWVSFGLSASIAGAAVWRRGWMPAWVPAAAAVSVIFVVLVSYPIIANRIESDDRGSAQSRIPLIQMGLQVMKEHPAVGVGAGNCHHAILAAAGTASYRSDWLYTIHNKYILVGVETGVVGLLFFLWFLTDTIRQGWQGWCMNDRILSPVALTIGAALLGQMVHMLVEIFNGRPAVQGFWLCAGLLSAISCLPATDQPRGVP